MNLNLILLVISFLCIGQCGCKQSGSNNSRPTFFQDVTSTANRTVVDLKLQLIESSIYKNSIKYKTYQLNKPEGHLQIIFEPLSLEEFNFLKLHYSRNTSLVRYNPDENYKLIDFLPPAIGAIAGKFLKISPKGYANANCYSTVYEVMSLKKDRYSLFLAHAPALIDAINQPEFSRELNKGEALKPLDIVISTTREHDHAMIYIDKGLVFDKPNPGIGITTPYRLRLNPLVEMIEDDIRGLTSKKYEERARKEFTGGASDSINSGFMERDEKNADTRRYYIFRTDKPLMDVTSPTSTIYHVKEEDGKYVPVFNMPIKVSALNYEIISDDKDLGRSKLSDSQLLFRDNQYFDKYFSEVSMSKELLEKLQSQEKEFKNCFLTLHSGYSYFIDDTLLDNQIILKCTTVNFENTNGNLSFSKDCKVSSNFLNKGLGELQEIFSSINQMASESLKNGYSENDCKGDSSCRFILEAKSLDNIKFHLQGVPPCAKSPYFRDR